MYETSDYGRACALGRRIDLEDDFVSSCLDAIEATRSECDIAQRKVEQGASRELRS